MKWATRAGIHIDRAACIWLIRRAVDTDAEFVFVSDPAEVPADATPFDMRGVDLGHQDGDCSFESILRRSPRYTRVIEILGGLYTEQGRIADGLRMDRRLVRLQPSNPTAHYNLACSLALTRRRADALRELRRALDLGYDDFRWMQQDPDLASLRDDPEFRALFPAVGKSG